MCSLNEESNTSAAALQQKSPTSFSSEIPAAMLLSASAKNLQVFVFANEESETSAAILLQQHLRLRLLLLLLLLLPLLLLLLLRPLLPVTVDGHAAKATGVADKEIVETRLVRKEKNGAKKGLCL